MTLRRAAFAALLAAAAYLVYFYGFSLRGLVAEDEPRYASIAREMAESGDWVTPRLGGEPWFEKPSLLYWIGATAILSGLEADVATRIPVAAISIAFLAAYFVILKRHFGATAASFSAAILGSSAGWVAFSQVGVFDLPLAASLGLGLLLLLDWIDDPSQSRPWMWFGIWVGVSALAKGLVGPVLAALALLPLMYERGARVVIREAAHARVVIPFLLTALPWYALCYWRNGDPFLDEFFWKHHFARFASASLRHEQPVWYYLPVLVVALLPWSPLLLRPPVDAIRRDPRVRFLAFWAGSTLVFFSASQNKLPGYLLPMLPPLAALMGIQLAGAQRAAKWLIVACGLTLLLNPLAIAVLPEALADGLSRAWPPGNLDWRALLAAVAALAVGAVAVARSKISLAVGAVAAGAVFGYFLIKAETYPAIDRAAGTRWLWRQAEPHATETCVGEVRRKIEYGLDFYSRHTLPPCASTSLRYRIESDPPVFTELPPNL